MPQKTGVAVSKSAFKSREASNLYGLIIAGGSGTRLWPLSRKLYPKHLLNLFGGETLLQRTFSRLKKIIPEERIYLVTNESLRDNIFFQLKDFGFKKENLLVEPESKNTAPAVGFGAKLIYEKNPAALLVISPADHFIVPDAKFKETILRAKRAAENDFLVTLGVKPDHPSPDYGYIKPDSSGMKNKGVGGWPAEKFIEKPNIKKAKELINLGYLWNSGIFIFKAAVILQNFREHMPAVYRVLEGVGAGQSVEFSENYRRLQAVSLDVGIMEKAGRVWVAPADFQWRDLGSWKALYDLFKKDGKGNVVLNKNILQVDCRDSLFYGSPKRVIAALGLKDLVVVDTEDAVLVAQKNKSQEIKEIFSRLQKGGSPQCFEHPTVYRPWGYYTVLEEGEGFKVKKISVLPRAKLSLQLHKNRSEHWVVLRGRGRAEIEGQIIDLKPHRSASVPRNTKHRLRNCGAEPLEIVEIQSGGYLGEDDIIRFDDEYGRMQES